MTIRKATRQDDDAIWRVLEPIFREGETYPIDPNCTREDALDYWFQAKKTIYVFEDGGDILGTYYICANSTGPADHVCNCGYAVHPAARGQGIARQLAEHSFAIARQMGFRGMQYNLVVATNTVAVSLWQKLGMEMVGTLHGAFRHPKLGDVDAYVMFKRLD